ncbi:MAG: hypothetical protein HKN63_11435 [Rhodobacteraceae bacterium]|nr:hypothetical protein [Paracoccaceae bacterium]
MGRHADQSLWDMAMGILRCLRRMPLWVQIWMALVLIPTNLGGLFFLGEPYAAVILILANVAMLIVAVMIVAQNGTSKIMSAPHVVCRVALLALLAALLSGGIDASAGYVSYLWVLMAVNALALGFDSYATWCWLCGDREIV